MKRVFLLAVVATLAFAAPASAQTTACKVGYYAPGIEAEFPAPGKLRAHDLPRKTNDDAPRCLVAESIVSNVQVAWARYGHAPRTVHPYGASWDGGRWRVSYRLATNGDSSWGVFTATHGRARVTWEGYS